jgi:hypothetical protein
LFAAYICNPAKNFGASAKSVGNPSKKGFWGFPNNVLDLNAS